MASDVSKSKLVDNMTNGSATVVKSIGGKVKRPYGPNLRPGNFKQNQVKSGVAKGGKPK